VKRGQLQKINNKKNLKHQLNELNRLDMSHGIATFKK